MAPSAHSESHLRSVLKGISYRFFGTLFTTALSFAMTRSTKTALLLGAAEFTFKVFLFWGHERVWARVRWGRGHRPATTVTTKAVAPASASPMLSLHAPPHRIYARGES